MSTTLAALGIDRLSYQERLTLAFEIWDSIVAENQPVPLGDAKLQDLRRRVAEDDANPDDVVPWEVVKAQALNRLKSMSLPVSFRALAQAEFEEPIARYEQGRTGMGATIAQAVQDIVTEISRSPQRYPIIDDDVREAPVVGSPFCVYYRVRTRGIVVISL